MDQCEQGKTEAFYNVRNFETSATANQIKEEKNISFLFHLKADDIKE
jgi:hypothetical protein